MTRYARALLAACLLFFCAGASAGGFTLKDMQGQTHRLGDYRGKWVLVNFWATWCPPCLEELPELSALHTAHKEQDLVVLGVVMEYPSTGVVRDFLKQHPLPYPIVLGNYQMADQIGPVNALPTSYLYNPEGKLAGQQPGAITREAVEEYIRRKK